MSGQVKRNIEDPNDPAQYNALPFDQKEILRFWIDLRIEPARGYCNLCSSYALKHVFQQDTGLWVSNGAIKGAMLEAGYKPKDTQDVNSAYKIRPPRWVRAPIGWWAAEYDFRVEYDSKGKAHVLRLQDGTLRPP